MISDTCMYLYQENSILRVMASGGVGRVLHLLSFICLFFLPSSAHYFLLIGVRIHITFAFLYGQSIAVKV